MKILWWSTVSPEAATAYGKISRYLPRELQKLGHEITIFSSVGQEYGIVENNGITLYPNPGNSRTLGLEFAMRVYDKVKADVCIWHGDCWPWHDTFNKACQQMPMILHCPVDHFPLSNYEYDAMLRARAVMLPSHFGVNVALKGGIAGARYAPHGVDLDIFHPLDKAQARATLGWHPMAFYFVSVATNKQDRKNGYNILRAYKMFLDLSPEYRQKTRLYMHTYTDRDVNNSEGYELTNIALSLGIMENVIFPSPATYLEGVPDVVMALIYNAGNVLLLPSKAEGFGMPIIEAGACGMPTIGTDFSAIPELIGNRGWLIDVIDYEVQQLQGITWQALPSTNTLVYNMLDSYQHSETERKFGYEMTQFVRDNFTWRMVAEPWRVLLAEMEQRPAEFPSWMPHNMLPIQTAPANDKT